MADPMTLAAGAAATGGGIIAGARGTPDDVKTTTTDMTNTRSTQLNPLTEEQRQMQRQSFDNYLKQLALAQQYEEGIQGAQGYQDLARQQAMGIMSGNAMQATPEEVQQIMNQRNAQVAISQQTIQDFLNKNLQERLSDAGQRGMRGQALAQYESDAIKQAASELAQNTRQADLMSSQAMLNQPYQRINAMSPFIQGGISMRDQMIGQAQQNRVAAQNPFLMQMLQQERLGTGTVTDTQKGSTQEVVKGEQGSFWGAVQGGLQSGAALASGAAKAGA